MSLWLLSDKLTQFDDADKRWREENPDDGAVDEVIFLSRHAAESGRPCLTVHPIGTPSTARADPERFGGRPGRCPPPNLRMASLLRRVKAHAESLNVTPNLIDREYNDRIIEIHKQPTMETLNYA